MHAFELLMHGLQLTLDMVALRKSIEGRQCQFDVLFGVDQQTTLEASRFVTHRDGTASLIKKQRDALGCARHNHLGID